MRSCLILLALVALVCGNSSQEHKGATNVINHGPSKNLRQRDLHAKLKEHGRGVIDSIYAKGPAGVSGKIPYASDYSDDEPRAPASVDAKVPYAADYYGEKGSPGSASSDAKGPGVAGYYDEKDISATDSTWVEAPYPGKGVDASYGGKSDEGRWSSGGRVDDTLESKAKVARGLVHKSRWMALGTRASPPDFKEYTGTNVQLVTDVIKGKSTGIPYTYMSQKDFSVYDLLGDDHASILFSQATIDDSCKKLPLEAKDPACPRTMLIGEMNRIDNSTQEYKDAYKSLMDKFPALKKVDKKEYDVGKMVITAVFVRANDGGIEPLPMDLYEEAGAGRRPGR